MKSCCEDKEAELRVLREKQGKVLKWVLGINGLMFFVEIVAGIVLGSTALMADSLDMFGDAVVYGFSLYVLERSARWRASAAVIKGGLMLAFGVGVIGNAIWSALGESIPNAPGMGLIAGLALAANVICLLLLFRHRSNDLNLRSTWLCSRNDVISNVGVIAAAGLVAVTGTRWPDIAVGVLIAGLFLSSAFSVLSEASGALREAK